eukprot:TRINITY_DN220_c0_g1_i8.p1 TRINITY_DN220_c0_g1~~TRINITY_DN220_c0_g1_i8.p1  ORF type:complete len:167 (+),score=4.43 TRINITY_DN220_c0_g1_i8:422-922(+)
MEEPPTNQLYPKSSPHFFSLSLCPLQSSVEIIYIFFYTFFFFYSPPPLQFAKLPQFLRIVICFLRCSLLLFLEVCCFLSSRFSFLAKMMYSFGNLLSPCVLCWFSEKRNIEGQQKLTADTMMTISIAVVCVPVFPPLHPVIPPFFKKSVVMNVLSVASSLWVFVVL